MASERSAKPVMGTNRSLITDLEVGVPLPEMSVDGKVPRHLGLSERDEKFQLVEPDDEEDD